MTDEPLLYDVTLTVDAEGRSEADAMLKAFDSGGPFLARPLTVKAENGYLRVRFERVSDDPTEGPTTVEHQTPGAELVAGFHGFSHRQSLPVAVLKTLLTFSAIREIAGLPPRHELRIDVVPAPPLSQDSVSLRLSDAVSDEFPRFGAGPDGD